MGMARITEKRLYAVPSQNFTANGDQSGKVTIANTTNFVVGHIVIIKSNTQPSLILKVKRIISNTEMFVGPEKEPIQARVDLSLYLVADTATVHASEQNRPSIPEQDVERNTYAEEPTVARRVTLVNPMGDQYDALNPVPVSATINIGDIRITAQDDDPNPGNQHSSVRVSDGVENLSVNPDGSINVVVVSGSGHDNPLRNSDSSTITTAAYEEVYSYTSLSASTYIIKVESTCETTSIFRVLVNGITLKEKRSSPMERNIEFRFDENYKLGIGDTLSVEVQVERKFTVNPYAFTSIEGYIL